MVCGQRSTSSSFIHGVFVAWLAKRPRDALGCSSEECDPSTRPPCQLSVGSGAGQLFVVSLGWVSGTLPAAPGHTRGWLLDRSALLPPSSPHHPKNLPSPAKELGQHR